MQIRITVPAQDGEAARDDVPWSWLKAVTFRGSQHDFSSVAVYARERVTLRLTEASREAAEVVDEHYLTTLGVQPVLGRNFVPDENSPKGKAVVLINETFWNRRLDADPAVLGRRLDIEGAPYTVIGVLPAGFHGLTGDADLWMTVGARRPFMFDPGEAWDHEFRMVGRLARGTAARAQSRAVAVCPGDTRPGLPAARRAG